MLSADEDGRDCNWAVRGAEIRELIWRKVDMATQAASAMATAAGGALKLELVAKFPNLRALAWDGDVLYASRGYELLSARVDAPEIEWRKVGGYRPEWWRNLSCRNRLSF